MRIFLPTLLIITNLFSQNYGLPKNFNIATSQLEYEEVVILDSNDSKDVLFDELKKWIATVYEDYDSVVKLDDKESGNIVVKGNIPFKVGAYGKIKINGSYEVFIYHILEIQVKDGRYKYRLSASYISNIYGYKNYFNELKRQNHSRYSWIKFSDEELQSLLTSMKNFVANETNKEDW